MVISNAGSLLTDWNILAKPGVSITSKPKGVFSNCNFLVLDLDSKTLFYMRLLARVDFPAPILPNNKTLILGSLVKSLCYGSVFGFLVNSYLILSIIRFLVEIYSFFIFVS